MNAINAIGFFYASIMKIAMPFTLRALTGSFSALCQMLDAHARS
jgi:hypothetical protein